MAGSLLMQTGADTKSPNQQNWIAALKKNLIRLFFITILQINQRPESKLSVQQPEW